MSTNVKSIAIRCILSSSKCTKTRFRLGLRPGPRWGAYNAPLDPLVGWGGDTPSHTLPSWCLRRLDLGAYDASVVTPPNTNSWLRLWRLVIRKLMQARAHLSHCAPRVTSTRDARSHVQVHCARRNAIFAAPNRPTATVHYSLCVWMNRANVPDDVIASRFSG